MGQRTEAAAGCLTAVVGAGAGFALWSVNVRSRWWRFEQSPDWSVFYAELPLAVLGGTAVSLCGWALLRRFRPRR